MSKLHPQPAPVGAFSVHEFASAFKISRSTTYELIESGQLRSFHVGRRRLISYQAAREWQTVLEKSQARTSTEA
jgi:excisionase family DNA binding protein